jgi:LEA14-like dessication related protein|tara:strand:- start:1778 stop:2272 length:495 start_codon:yes stop_codon:yes gene_type:complete
MNPPGRIVPVIAIFGLIAMLGGGVYYASLDNDDLESATIELTSVEILDVNSIENSATLEVIFTITNPSDLTFTVPVITYELYANGNVMGAGAYSTEDIAMPGRAAFYPGTEIPLESWFSLKLTDENQQQYYAIVSGENIDYDAVGILTVESAWSIVEPPFDTRN